jgi:hypothetical protein
MNKYIVPNMIFGKMPVGASKEHASLDFVPSSVEHIMRVVWRSMLWDLSNNPTSIFDSFCKEGLITFENEPVNAKGLADALVGLRQIYGLYEAITCSYTMRYNHRSIYAYKLRDAVFSKLSRLYSIDVLKAYNENYAMSTNSGSFRGLIFTGTCDTNLQELHEYAGNSDTHFLEMFSRHFTSPPYPNTIQLCFNKILYGSLLAFSDGNRLFYVAVPQIPSFITEMRPGSSKSLPVLSFNIAAEKHFLDRGTSSVEFIKDISANFESHGVPVVPFEKLIEMSMQSEYIEPIDAVSKLLR